MPMLKTLVRRLFGTAVAVLLTFALFLVLPLMQSIGKAPEDKYAVQTVALPTLDDVPELEDEEPPPDEPEEIEDPPDLPDEPLSLNIDALDLPIGTGGVGGVLNPDMRIDISNVIDSKQGGMLDDFGGFDQKPRLAVPVSPQVTEAMRRVLKKQAVRVVVRFMIDERGKVVRAQIHSSNHPLFDRAVLRVARNCRFDPAKRGGKPVPSRALLPFAFPKE